MGNRFKRGQFTLVELVMVVTIIAILAGFLIPQVSMIGRSTDMAASANNQGEIAKNIQMFFTLQKRYPVYMDSLLVAEQAEQAPKALYTTGANASFKDSDGNQIAGLPDSGPHLDDALKMEDIGPANASYEPGTYLRSFSRSGFDYVMHHDAGESNSNKSGKYKSTKIPNGKEEGQSFHAAVVDAAVDASGKYTNSAAADLIGRLLGESGLPDGTKLVALGFGPKNSSIGKTSLNAPIYSGCDGSYYGNFVAIFMIYDTGERASLVGVVDSYGRTLNYTIDQYTESLPDGARQG